MEGKTDVNELWRKLNKSQPASGRSTSFEKLWHGFSSDISSGKVNKSRDTAKHKEYDICWLQPSACRAAAQQQQPAAAKGRENSVASPGLDGVALERLALSLQGTDASVRRTALQQIKATFVKPATPSQTAAAAPTADSRSAEDEAAEAAEAAVQALNSKLAKGLLRRFDDGSEACRELAVSSFLGLLRVAPDATLSLLPYAMPVLEERLHAGQANNPCEPSEEVRLLLAQLLSQILDAAGSAIAAYASEVWSVLSCCLADSYHEVAMVGCKVAQQLSAILGLRMGSTAKELVAALLPLTTHKRHRVRVAAIEAVRDVVHQGAHEMILEMVGWRDPNMVPIKAFYGDDIKVNYCGKLATDHHVQVRLAFLAMVGSWMLSLRERTDHEARLLPYLLSGLCDESPAVVNTALQLLEQLGQQFEKEHEKDLQDFLRFAGQGQDDSEVQLLAAFQQGTLAYAGVVAAAAAAAAPVLHEASATTTTLTLIGEAAAPGLGAAKNGAGYNADQATPPGTALFTLPGPFSHRPRLGSRLLVRNNFGTALPALCAELSAWQSGPRAMSARLLLVNLLLAESAAERHLQVLLPALCAAVRDTDAGAAVADCAAVLGCYCDFQLLLDLLSPRVTEVTGEAVRQADALLVLAAIFRGAGPIGSLQGHAQQLMLLLSQPGIADSQDSNIKAALTAVLQQLLLPGLLQQLLADTNDPAAAAAAEGSSSKVDGAACIVATSCTIPGEGGHQQPQQALQPSCLLVSLVQLLLQLGACDGPLQGSETAAAQVDRVEALFAALAVCAGYSSVDELLGSCRSQLLDKLGSSIEADSTAAVHAVCRLLLPSSCCWLLTVNGSHNVNHRQPIVTQNSTQAIQSSRSSCSSSSSSSSAAVAAGLNVRPNSEDVVSKHGGTVGGMILKQADILPFSALAAAACQPSHLSTLLQLVAAAERQCSRQLQHTPGHLHLLQATLDCCMQVWPQAAFDQQVLRRLLHSAVPVLLSSSRSLAALTGLRALHWVMLRGMLVVLEDDATYKRNKDSSIDNGEQKQQQQQQQCAIATQQQAAAGLLKESWQQHGLCQMVCRLLTSIVVPVRLEACNVLLAVIACLGEDCILQHSSEANAAAPQQQAIATEPAAALKAALDDADADVRAAASQALQQMTQLKLVCYSALCKRS